MSRSTLSRPLQQAHADGLLDGAVSVFDYGCGRGDDVRTLRAIGVAADGWDPAHAAGTARHAAPVVNIGYVVNVIEDEDERAAALRAAWGLTESVLVVSARLTWDPDSEKGKPYRDGYLTSAGTFQKYFTPEELKAWVQATLGVTAFTAAPGILYVFRHLAAAQQLIARHSRSRGAPPRLGIAELLYQQRTDLLAPLEAFVETNRSLPTPADLPQVDQLCEVFGSVRSAFSIIRRATGASRWSDVQLGGRTRSEQRFEEHLQDLQPLIDFVSERGRLPRAGELANEQVLNEMFGSTRAAFSLVRRVTGPERWTDLEQQARESFLVYAALSAFAGRPTFTELPEDLQYDVKDLFGSYKAACAEADRLLYSIADVSLLDQACRAAPFGKLTPEALYVHTVGTSRLSPVLRVYIGAAETLTGAVEDATILKLHRLKPQVSFLAYPTFDRDPHPALESSLVARLPQLRTSYKDFSHSDNPPILHRKETFVPDDYPGREKFERLTRQEDRSGLLSASNIGRQRQWADALAESGYILRGHRLSRQESNRA